MRWRFQGRFNNSYLTFGAFPLLLLKSLMNGKYIPFCMHDDNIDPSDDNRLLFSVYRKSLGGKIENAYISMNIPIY